MIDRLTTMSVGDLLEEHHFTCSFHDDHQGRMEIQSELERRIRQSTVDAPAVNPVAEMRVIDLLNAYSHALHYTHSLSRMTEACDEVERRIGSNRVQAMTTVERKPIESMTTQELRLESDRLYVEVIGANRKRDRVIDEMNDRRLARNPK